MSRLFKVRRVGSLLRLEVLRSLVVVTGGWITQRPFYSFMRPVPTAKLCGWHIFQLTSRTHIAVRSNRGLS